MRAPALLGIPRPPTQLDQAKPTTPAEAIDKVIALFTALGWPEKHAICSVDYICARLAESKNRPAAHSLLRRDDGGRVSLDLDREAWATLIRLILGCPEPEYRFTRAGHGLLTLFMCGYEIPEFLADDDLILEISQIAPIPVRCPDLEPDDPDAESESADV